jgi:hypothetical protein
MAKFKSVPRPRSEEEFVASAEAPSAPLIPAPAPTPPEPAAVASVPLSVPTAMPQQPQATTPVRQTALPWDGLDPNERGTIPQTIRVNSRQHEQLKYLAALEDRSVSQILRRVLGPALEDAIERAQSGR